MNLRVLIIGDQKIVCEGLRSLLAKQPDVQLIGEAQSERQALELLEEIRPDLVIMNVKLSDECVEIARQVLIKTQNTKIIALLMNSNHRFVREMTRAGVHGYLLKDFGFEELVNAMSTVIQGHIYITPRIMDMIVEDYNSQLKISKLSNFLTLTGRQSELLHLIGEGYSIQDIARRMALNKNTVRYRRRQIMKKLNIYTVAGLTRYAFREGLTRRDT
jgi:DNA-binding NarL/FixJ family response regulator